MNNCCDLNSNNTNTDFLIMQLKREIEDKCNDINARLFLQDGKIAEACTYIKDNLSTYLREIIDTMNYSGELDNLIAATLTNIVPELESLYYTDEIIYSEKFTDSETGSDYYVTHVKKSCCSNDIDLNFGIANDDETASTLESTVEFAHRKNASLCINAGIYNVYNYNPLGICIKDGRVVKDEPLTDSRYRYLGIDKYGNLHCYPYTATSNQMLRDGMIHAFCSFTDLIIDGVASDLADTTNYDPRNAIGQKSNGDYVIVTVDGRSSDNLGFRYPDLTRIFQKYGCTFAVALDGGGSASTVVRGIKQNDDIDSSFNDRAVSNFLYITKKSNLDPSLNPFNAIGWLKQRMMKLSNTLVNFEKGYIRLKAPKGQHYPGIEIYSNGEKKRSAKLGFTSASDLARRIVFSMDDNGTEKNVFGASPKGLMDIDGLLAKFNRKPILVDDCNSIKNTGLYRVDSSTKNKPYECTIGYTIHVSIYDDTDVTNGNARQIFFSKDKDWFFTRTINENGSVNDWRPLSNYKGATTDRPTGVTGLMFFDTTINKPIWYNGTNWVDSTGTSI